MNRKDMFLLLQAEADLHKLDNILVELTGYGYGQGVFKKLDNICDVIQHNSIPLYQNSNDDFYKVLLNRELSIDDKCKILLGESTIDEFL